MRIPGDGDQPGGSRGSRWGGWGNAAAIILFLGGTAYSALTGAEEDTSGPELPPDAAAGGAEKPASTEAENIPDSQFESD